MTAEKSRARPPRTLTADPPTVPHEEEVGLHEVEALEPLFDAGSGRAPLVKQAVMGGLSGVAAVAMAIAFWVFPAEVQGGYLTTLPQAMILLLWALAALGTLVPAVRISRSARWAVVDEEAAPVPAWLARTGGASLLVMVLASFLILVGAFII